MKNWIIRVLGLKGSFIWACRQMKAGNIVKPADAVSAKYRFDSEGQGRIVWAFTHTPHGCVKWENANVFFKDIMATNWVVVE